MRTTDISPASAPGARTITMGRNRLNSIENWVKPPKPSKGRRAEGPAMEARAAAEPAAAPLDGAPSVPGSPAAPRPVSQFIRTSVLAARR